MRFGVDEVVAAAAGRADALDVAKVEDAFEVGGLVGLVGLELAALLLQPHVLERVHDVHEAHVFPDLLDLEHRVQAPGVSPVALGAVQPPELPADIFFLDLPLFHYKGARTQIRIRLEVAPQVLGHFAAEDLALAPYTQGRLEERGPALHRARLRVAGHLAPLANRVLEGVHLAAAGHRVELQVLHRAQVVVRNVVLQLHSPRNRHRLAHRKPLRDVRLLHPVQVALDVDFYRVLVALGYFFTRFGVVLRAYFGGVVGQRGQFRQGLETVEVPVRRLQLRNR